VEKLLSALAELWQSEEYGAVHQWRSAKRAEAHFLAEAPEIIP